MVLIQCSRRLWQAYEDPLEIIETRDQERVLPLIRHIESRVEKEGLFAAGYLRYEAAPAFDPALQTHVAPVGQPLIRFGLYSRFRTGLLKTFIPESRTPYGEWKPLVNEPDYRSALNRIREYLEAGDTYQVNYTLPLEGPPLPKNRTPAMFRRWIEGQQGSYGAWVEGEESQILSLSPELFFRLEGERLYCRPMKGTVLRGRWPEEDRRRREELKSSSKDQAENLMIADMIRNDLGRVADSGSVEVEKLFSLEEYPTVHQMTSGIRCRSKAGLGDILQALFPCASITGAPKVRTMEIIRELEPAPRGIYCGSIGFYHPGRKAQFNVAIRTLENFRDRSVYSVGGGILWDSTSEKEYAEAMLKSRVLQSPLPDFDLLETLRWDSQKGYLRLKEHLDRMEWSAHFFGFPWDRNHVMDQLKQEGNQFKDSVVSEEKNGKKCFRVRLLLRRQGSLKVEFHDLPEIPDTPTPFILSPLPVDSNHLLLFHKTSYRDFYQEREREPGVFTLLQNEVGELTEFTIGNLVMNKQGRLLTPPLECGLLPGVLRRSLLQEGILEESRLYPEDLPKAEEIFLINSLRGWVPLRAVPGP